MDALHHPGDRRIRSQTGVPPEGVVDALQLDRQWLVLRQGAAGKRTLPRFSGQPFEQLPGFLRVLGFGVNAPTHPHDDAFMTGRTAGQWYNCPFQPRCRIQGLLEPGTPVFSKLSPACLL